MKTLQATLLRTRNRLQACLELMHDEAHASAKEELRRAIETLDGLLESDQRQVTTHVVLRVVGRVLDKVPMIVSILKELE